MVHDLPGVGENLQDHLELYLQYACTQPVSLYPSLLWWNQPAIGAEWMFLGKGIGAAASIPGNLVQAVMGLAIGLILFFLLKRSKALDKLGLQ